MPRILLVEDNEMNRDMLSRRLQRKGYEVALAVDGLQGVAMATAGGWDLILMDMSLPELDGWEATRRVREAETGTRVPIIALTAHAMKGDEDKFRAAGCDGYLAKPFQYSRLLAVVQEALCR